MRIGFDPGVEQLLRDVGHVAEDAGGHAWAVGGVVRDAILGVPSRDLDVAIAGDFGRVVERLRASWSAVVEQHDAFFTATLVADGLPAVDIVCVRRETYSRPGALPDVVPAGIEDDLARRDFTVNALAADLSASAFGEVLDPQSGCRDIEERTLRILHTGSFEDDPTRLLRAARYAVRFGLSPDPDTHAAACAAVAGGALQTVSADRLRREIELLLSEAQWAEATAWLNLWGVWSNLCEGWEPPSAWLKRIDVVRNWATRSIREDVPSATELRWLHLVALAPDQIGEALSVKPAEARLVESIHGIHESLSDPETPGWWRAMDAEPLSVLLVAIAQCRSDSEKARLSRYVGTVRSMRLGISGDDIVAKGALPGPELGDALRMTLDAVRVSGLHDREAQMKYALDVWRERVAAKGDC